MVGLKRLSYALLAGGMLLASALASAATPAGFSPSVQERLKAGFEAALGDDWERVRTLRRELDDPLAARLLLWLELKDRDSGARFEAIDAFLAETPGWPYQRQLRANAERAMPEGLGTEAVLDFFQRHPPITTEGEVRFGEALITAKETARGTEYLRYAWINGSFEPRAERDFVTRHGYKLQPGDHTARLDRLLWQGEHGAAKRMFDLVGPDWRALAEARIALRAGDKKVDAAIRRVPAGFQADPGLIHERIRWRRQQGLYLEARRLLEEHRLDRVNPELWWRERAILARQALNDGHVSEAFRLAQGHAVPSGVGFADAEWLAGWIALRFLDEPKVALEHFARLYAGVSYPISRARGAYWAGRAAEAAGQHDIAARWYETAARHPTTYYGQLAAHKVLAGEPLRLPPDPNPSADEAAAFAEHEFVRVVRALAAIDERDALRGFVVQLAAERTSPGWGALTAELLDDLGQPALATYVAKRTLRSGQPLIGRGYPTIALPEDVNDGVPLVEIPLTFAVTRQESLFDPSVISRAGARGLMQLMPGTAKQVAGKLDLPYSQTRLTDDPIYNVTLGQAYLTELLERYNGSYILAIAAYNAGPHRVDGWLAVNGDPRESLTRAVDWIELIPFEETRNYVQRTLENLQVYRALLGPTRVALNLKDDLQR